MKKRLFGTLLAAALVMTSTVTALAAGSITASVPTVPAEYVGKVEVKEINTENPLPELAKEKPEVVNAIVEINEGKASVEIIAEQAPELKETLEDKTLVSKFVDVNVTDAAEKTPDGKWKVGLAVPSLSEEMSDVLVLHYSTERNVWETITPSKVDVANKIVEAEFQDLSPVAIIAKVDAEKAADKAAGTSPKTGVVSDWGMFMGAAVVLFGASVVVLKKNRTKA